MAAAWQLSKMGRPRIGGIQSPPGHRNIQCCLHVDTLCFLTVWNSVAPAAGAHGFLALREPVNCSHHDAGPIRIIHDATMHGVVWHLEP